MIKPFFLIFLPEIFVLKSLIYFAKFAGIKQLVIFDVYCALLLKLFHKCNLNDVRCHRHRTTDLDCFGAIDPAVGHVKRTSFLKFLGPVPYSHC